MMENSILNQLPFDPAYLLLGMAGLCILLIILVIIQMIRLSRLNRKYDYFMRGKDAETMEDMILDELDEIKNLKAENRASKDSIRTLNRTFRSSCQKFGVVRDNAFEEMG